MQGDRSARWAVLKLAEYLRVITRVTEVLIVSNVASWIAIIILLMTKLSKGIASYSGAIARLGF